MVRQVAPFLVARLHNALLLCALGSAAPAQEVQVPREVESAQFNASGGNGGNLLASRRGGLPIGLGSGAGGSLELAKLVASDPADQDLFGHVVAVSGDTAVVGAHWDDHAGGTDAGSAYVFERDQAGPGAWGEVVKLTASDAAAGDEFGFSVAIFGDTVVVGAYRDNHTGGLQAGSAYVFERDQGGAGAWGEVVKLTASDAAAGDEFGISVAISSDKAVVGAHRSGFGNVGSAYVFERDQGGPGAWGAVMKLTAPDAAFEDRFGHSVAVSGDTAVVGAHFDDLGRPGVDAGSAYVFERDQGGPGAWGAAAKLIASNAGTGDTFGNSVAVSGDTAMVGAHGVDHPGGGEGSAYVFERDQGGPGAWDEVLELTASDMGVTDLFGWSVAISGDTAVVGAFLNDPAGATDAGSAYVFERDQGGPGTWGEVVKLTASDAAAGDQFGTSVAISGVTTLVGAIWDDHAGATNAGSAYVFGLSFTSETYCTAGTSASGCHALLSASGTPSATAASGFTLEASTVEGQKDGLFFFGTNGQQANSWGNGTSYQCVVPPVVRAGTLSGTGTIGLCDGSFAQDLNALWCPTCPKPAKNPGAGAIVQAQLWYRDPLSTSNQTTSLSDAIEFVVSP